MVTSGYFCIFLVHANVRAILCTTISMLIGYAIAYLKKNTARVFYEKIL